MSGLPLTRTEYWSLSIPGSVRTGATGHGESLTDMENFLLPLSQSALSALRTPGVADGLTVTATAQPQGLTVSPGVALDVNGHLIVLAAGGVAIVDPAANPSQLVNVPTVQVSAAGATVATAGSAVTGDVLLTVTYAEVVRGNSPARRCWCTLRGSGCSPPRTSPPTRWSWPGSPWTRPGTSPPCPRPVGRCPACRPPRCRSVGRGPPRDRRCRWTSPSSPSSRPAATAG